MTKIRFNVNEAGELVDRNGQVLGRIVSLTVELPAEGRGGLWGGGVDSQSATSVVEEGSSSNNREKSPRETDEPTLIDKLVAEVWSYWIDARKPRRTELDQQAGKLIAKAIRADFTVPELCQAIDGLLSSDWHREHKRLHLSTIFATRPGGPTLRDQVEGFIERSTAAGEGGQVPSAWQGPVDSLKADVRRGLYSEPGRPEPGESAAERAREAIAKLESEYGIKTSFRDDGWPVFA